MASLNMMRSLLVGGAVLAAAVAAFLQQWTVVAILSVGIAAHAGLWVYLGRVPAGTASSSPHAGSPDTAADTPA